MKCIFNFDPGVHHPWRLWINAVGAPSPARIAARTPLLQLVG
jgi:hypothetical protein